MGFSSKIDKCDGNLKFRHNPWLDQLVIHIRFRILSLFIILCCLINSSEDCTSFLSAEHYWKLWGKFWMNFPIFRHLNKLRSKRIFFRERLKALAEENLKMAEEQKLKTQYMEKVVYSNRPTAAFFDQFNKSTRWNLPTFHSIPSCLYILLHFYQKVSNFFQPNPTVIHIYVSYLFYLRIILFRIWIFFRWPQRFLYFFSELHEFHWIWKRIGYVEGFFWHCG